MMAEHANRRPDQRRDKEARHAAKQDTLGDAPVITLGEFVGYFRPRDSAPSSKDYQKQLDAMLKQHDDKIISKIDQPAREITIGQDKVTTAVIEQVRPTGPAADAPKDTLVVNRYLFWKDGKLLTLSMSSVRVIGTPLTAPATQLLGGSGVPSA
jgi:hypothetical protein